jgi:hypothetical protein
LRHRISACCRNYKCEGMTMKRSNDDGERGFRHSGEESEDCCESSVNEHQRSLEMKSG